MLATLRWSAILLGLAGGSLATTVSALALWALFSVLGRDDAPLLGLIFGILFGFLVGGYASGRTARIVHRFHGSVTGLGLAGIVVIVARLGGSPAPIPQVLLVALLGIVFGGIGGTLGARRRT